MKKKKKEELDREMTYLEGLMNASDGEGVEFRTKKDLEVRYEWSRRYIEARESS